MQCDPNLRKLLDSLPPEALSSMLSQATEALAALDRNKLATYIPYPKQRMFHDAGAEYRERLFLGGNQLGKTWSAGYETAMHATGRYPDWWHGRRFRKQTRGWCSGVTGETGRDSVQEILLGPITDQGTGCIPAECIEDVISARGVAGQVDSVVVKFEGGGRSRINFKSYVQGREKWQAATLDWIWFDEEPPEPIYNEGLTRITATDGLVWMTFTPLLGATSVVNRFLEQPAGQPHPDRHVTTITIDDALHIAPEKRAQIIAGYSEHEREARSMGIPQLGSGKVFPIPEADIKEPAPELQRVWPRIAGLDIGWDHPTAVVWLAWDRDADCIHVYDCYRLKEQTPVIHAAAIKARGPWIPMAWPHDGLQHDKGSGEQIAELYRAQGVAMLNERATFEDGSNGVEAGVIDMIDRMKTGRFKVAEHLHDWWEEYRLYHRKNGLIVKERDDLMSATRYAVMMLRYATLVARPSNGGRVVGSWMT